MNTDLEKNEKALRVAWEASRPEPSREVMARIKERIDDAATLHAKPASSRNLVYLWRPVLSAAASLVLFAGVYAFWHQNSSDNVVWRELQAVEDEINDELYSLEATVWDMLAEMEAESPSDELQLHAVSLQMVLWEE